MRFIKQQGFVIISALLLILAGIGSVMAADLSSVNVTAASRAPGEETSYVVKFRANMALDLSKGASIAVEFPPEFKIVQNEILAANPGCTLARLEYKNPEDRFYAVVHGTIGVKKLQDGVQCSFKPQLEQLVIPAQTDLYLTIPGVVNPSAIGHNMLNITIQDAGQVTYQGAANFSLGPAPGTAPTNVRVMEASSKKVRLVWDPVPGATRYQVVFSSQPAGRYISALDLTMEPYPGEEWQLTDTTHSFTGRGQGGLSPGDMYYFKVRAGNEFGFGPSSVFMRIILPEIKLLDNQTRDTIEGSTKVIQGNDVVVRTNQPAKIANEDCIRVYEKKSGLRVKQVQTVVDESDNNVIRINAGLQPGKEYLIVLYEGALESRTQPGIFNRTLSWTVTVTAYEGG